MRLYWTSVSLRICFLVDGRFCPGGSDATQTPSNCVCNCSPSLKLIHVTPSFSHHVLPLSPSEKQRGKKGKGGRGSGGGGGEGGGDEVYFFWYITISRLVIIKSKQRYMTVSCWSGCGLHNTRSASVYHIAVIPPAYPAGGVPRRLPTGWCVLCQPTPPTPTCTQLVRPVL